MERSKKRDGYGSMRNRTRERMKEQDTSTAAWAIDIPEEIRLELKENTKERGICIKYLDFLPYITSDNIEVTPGEIWWRRRYGFHRNIGVDNKMRLCLKATYNKPCPIDGHQLEMFTGAKTEEEKNVAKALHTKLRDIYNVIDLDDESKGPQVLDMSYHCFGKQLKAELDIAEGYKFDGFADLSGGFTLVCRFIKRVFGENEYWEVNRIDFKERDDYPDSILEQTHDLDKFLKPLSYEALEKEFLGAEDIEQEEITRSIERTKPSERAEKARERTRNKDTEEETLSKKETEKEPLDEKDKEKSLSREHTTTRAERIRERQTEKIKENECSYGHRFGVDTDAFDDCDKCHIDKKDSYNSCGETYDKTNPPIDNAK